MMDIKARHEQLYEDTERLRYSQDRARYRAARKRLLLFQAKHRKSLQGQRLPQLEGGNHD